jgi:hypothetical protein
MSNTMTIRGALAVAAVVLLAAAAALDRDPRFNRLLAAGLACLAAGIAL